MTTHEGTPRPAEPGGADERELTVPEPVVRELDDEVGVKEVTRGKRRTVVYETPHGELVEDREYTVDRTWRTVGFPVRSRDDLWKGVAIQAEVKVEVEEEAVEEKPKGKNSGHTSEYPES